MTKNRWPSKATPKADNGAHPCDAGYCREPSCVDYGKHRRFAGIPGEVRYLCHKHAGKHEGLCVK